MNCPRKDLTLTLSVADGAKSGCKKCIKELETGENSKSKGDKHDVNCPLSRSKRVPLEEAAKSGCKKCVAELETGEKKKMSHDLNCPRKLYGKKKTSQDKTEHQPLVEEDDDLGYLNRRSQNNKQLLSTNNTTPSLVDGAKAGCRKCTLEWQTEEVDPQTSHDDCCPRRVGKRAPPSNNRPRLDSQKNGGSDSGSQRKSSLNKQGTSSTLAIGSQGTAGSFNSRNYNSSSVVKATSHSSTHRAYQPTPSPVPQPPQQQRPPQLPAEDEDELTNTGKENDATENNESAKFANKSSSAKTDHSAKLKAVRNGHKERLNDNISDAFINVLKNNSIEETETLIGIAAEELDDLEVPGNEDEKLVSKKAKADEELKSLELIRTLSVQNEMSTDEVDMKIRLKKKDVSEIEAKIKHDKNAPIISLKEKYDETYDEIMNQIEEMWGEYEGGEKSCLVKAKSKWNAFWERAML